MISERFKASTHGFCHFLEKFESGQNALFSVILGHTLNVILGFIPRIHIKHLANVILGFIPRIHAKHSSSLDTRDKPEYDGRKRMCLKPENDHKRSLIKNLECIETAKSGVDKVVSSCEKNPNTLPENLDSVRECAEIFKRRVQKEYTSAKISSRHQLNEFSPNNLRPQCAPDTTGFLSDVYKRSTRAQKFLADGVQCGRSMIEMLGVLAIIGVLSVGGIQGFSKALDMYHWNKALGEWRLLINTLDRYRSQLHINDQTVANSEVSLVPILLAIGDLPNEMKIDNIDYLIKDSLNNKLFVYSHGTGYIGILSSNPKDNYAACHIFLTIGTYYHSMLERVQIYTHREENEETGRSRYFMGDSLCTKNNTNCLKDLGVAQIADICKNNPICKDRNNCNYLMYWF